MRAVLSKDVETVRALIDNGAIVTYIAKSGVLKDLNLSALTLAKMTGHEEILQMILDAGADPNEDPLKEHNERYGSATGSDWSTTRVIKPQYYSVYQ